MMFGLRYIGIPFQDVESLGRKILPDVIDNHKMLEAIYTKVEHTFLSKKVKLYYAPEVTHIAFYGMNKKHFVVKYNHLSEKFTHSTDDLLKLV